MFVEIIEKFAANDFFVCGKRKFTDFTGGNSVYGDWWSTGSCVPGVLGDGIVCNY